MGAGLSRDRWRCNREGAPCLELEWCRLSRFCLTNGGRVKESQSHVLFIHRRTASAEEGAPQMNFSVLLFQK